MLTSADNEEAPPLVDICALSVSIESLSQAFRQTQKKVRRQNSHAVAERKQRCSALRSLALPQMTCFTLSRTLRCALRGR